MRRILAAVLAVGLGGSAAEGKLIAMKPPAQRAATAEVVAVGTVTAVDADPVEALPYPGAEAKVKYKVAVVKVDEALAGAKGETHLRVGFIPPPKADGDAPVRPIRRRPNPAPELKAGDKYLFFLARHPDGKFYAMPAMSPPVPAGDKDAVKDDLAAVKKVLAVAAEPLQALKAEKAEDRHFAAVTLATKYRSYPEGAAETEEVAVPAEEGKLILRGLAEGDWAKFRRDTPNGLQAFYALGLTEADGWKMPEVNPAPGKEVNVGEVTKTAFTAWLAGPGKGYAVKKVVAKKELPAKK